MSLASEASSAAAKPSFPSSSNVPASILGFLRCAFGPNVSLKGSVSTIWDRYRTFSQRVY